MLSPVVIGIVVALVIGKPLGIMITAWLSTHVARADDGRRDCACATCSPQPARAASASRYRS